MLVVEVCIDQIVANDKMLISSIAVEYIHPHFWLEP